MDRSAETTFGRAVELVKAGTPEQEALETLLDALTDEQKLWLLDGDEDFWPGMRRMVTDGYGHAPTSQGVVPELGNPGLQFLDGPRGITAGGSTAFPVSMARGATWDVALEERVGRAIGLEMRAQGGNLFGGVCINLPRHPAWGRAQETYGEDPILLGELGAALVRGVRENGMTVAKHFALNSMENARFTCDVRVDDAALHEVYLPHFRRVVEEGVSAVMTSYNSVNGTWAGQNSHLIRDVLRGLWGFDGVTISDWVWGLRDGTESLRAGLDVEEPFRQQRFATLPRDLADGVIGWDLVDEAVRHTLLAQLRHTVALSTPEPSPEVVFSSTHRALAREVAGRSMVLLKNDPVDGVAVLPLDPAALTRVALIGRLAALASTGDLGSSNVRSPEVATPLDGLREALPDALIDHVAADDVAAATAVAAAADIAVVVVGYTAADEGEYVGADAFADPDLLALYPPTGGDPAAEELRARFEQGTADVTPGLIGGEGSGGDRASLRIRPFDADLIRAVATVNPRTVVVVVTAGAVITEEWKDAVPATLLSWYSGCEGGRALADVLLGRTDTSGRLPFSIPTSEDHLPFFDRHATSITYDRWFGQRLLDRLGVPPAYPLGFGLSYTRFAVSEPRIGDVDGERLRVAVTVTNTGERAGRHTVQIYGCPVGAGADFPSRVLLGFAGVELAPGERRSLEVPASIRPLQRWIDGGFVPAASVATIEIASWSGDPSALGGRVTLA